MATCRQSSEPMEPPAPVMSTRSPLRYPAISSTWSLTGFRPNRSSMRTSLTWSRATFPLAISINPGRIRTGSPVSLANATTSLSLCLGAEGIATKISSTRYIAAAWDNWSILPTTGIPCKRSLILLRSSSRTTTGRWGAGFCNISLIMRAPACPAPTTKTLFPILGLYSIELRISRRNRIPKRVPPISRILITQPIKSTLKGREGVRMIQSTNVINIEETVTALIIWIISGRLE